MKRVLVIALVLLVGGWSMAVELALIPQPNSQKTLDGSFVLQNGAKVFGAAKSDLYTEKLSQAAGFKLTASDKAGMINFLPADGLKSAATKPVGEAYLLRISPEAVNVYADSYAGYFYGLQTLVQILEAGIHTNGTVKVDCLEVYDSPRFEWRGFMLDESRHFTDAANVKKLLDAMAYYKMNRLHWHLTDSPAWRIEIKRYPKLTEIGSRGSETDRSADAPQQYFSRKQVQELVAYAKERAIIIVPEIDMPGHADAANIAYPENSGGGLTRSPGKWPNFTFNPARPQTLVFLDNILHDVARMFPDAEVIHIGGDEVHFGWKKWNSLPDVKDLMKREGLAGLPEVEAWFVRRMAGTVNNLGYVVGGWDEISARGLAPDKTLVFWWRHNKPNVLRKALDNGYSVVLCPRLPCYFDFVQHGSHKKGRRWGGFNTLDRVYRFPDSLKMLHKADYKLVRGIQSCLWTETMLTQQRRDFMTFPRLLALAEAGWTEPDKKDYTSFKNRLRLHLPRLRSRGIVVYDPFANSAEIKR